MYDHRKLGRELGVFDTDPLIGAGLPFWLPAGAVVRQSLADYLRSVERQAGYQQVCSPVLGKRELYEISGHWAYYRDEMFPLASDDLVLRPSLCPHHAVIYRSRAHSYRELPLRMAELGGQYRAELSGVLGGLTRVRAMQLNDAHIFATFDQVESEAAGAISMIRDGYAALGISPVRYRLSLAGSGEKYAGSDEMWSRASAMLRAVLDEAGVPYAAEAGEAAFYGPKIDVQVADYLDREATLSTVQVDFWQPSRFSLSYVGAFPPWLAPVQVAVLPVGEAELAAAWSFTRLCGSLRAEVSADGSLAARIRAARLVPYQVIIGPREATAGAVSVRLRDGRRFDALPAAEAAARIEAVAKAYGTRLWDE